MAFQSSSTNYVGEYCKDLREGRGKYTWANGDSYDGYWDNGEQSGRGRYHYSIDDVYEGNWANGRKNGRGFLFVKAERKVFFEIWKNGNVVKHEEVDPNNPASWPSLDEDEEEDDKETSPEQQTSNISSLFSASSSDPASFFALSQPAASSSSSSSSSPAAETSVNVPHCNFSAIATTAAAAAPSESPELMVQDATDSVCCSISQMNESKASISSNTVGTFSSLSGVDAIDDMDEDVFRASKLDGSRGPRSSHGNTTLRASSSREAMAIAAAAELFEQNKVTSESSEVATQEGQLAQEKRDVDKNGDAEISPLEIGTVESNHAAEKDGRSSTHDAEKVALPKP